MGNIPEGEFEAIDVKTKLRKISLNRRCTDASVSSTTF